ncbi:hypothetical protein NQ317_008478 [Molorchus minor]|uniref:Uncharacterized protein n=1 Tax=Molorchus minor TaxID=1323400 RepID=A0ABQ9JK98_9CUCU|nr:hypothetical protein NQ317_008478 [Molorchus minor]
MTAVIHEGDVCDTSRRRVSPFDTISKALYYKADLHLLCTLQTANNPIYVFWYRTSIEHHNGNASKSINITIIVIGMAKFNALAFKT